MSKKKIGVFVGSARKASFSKQIANNLAAMMAKEHEIVFVDLTGLPIYNQDLDDEGRPPAAWTALRRQVKALDAFLFVTPEYNRSFPPVLKNALDIASRPYGQNVWGGKPGAVVSVSPGKIGGFGANNHLRQVLAFLDICVMAQPEAYIGGADGMFDSDGNARDEGTRGFLGSIATGFARWVERFYP